MLITKQTQFPKLSFSLSNIELASTKNLFARDWIGYPKMKSFLIMVGVMLFAVPIYIRLLYHVPYIIAGSLIPVITLAIAGTYLSLQGFDRKKYAESRTARFAFHKTKNWMSNMQDLKDELSSNIDKQIYPENFIINDTLNNIVSLILRDFVESWFAKISSNKIFVASLRHEFTYIIQMLHNRLKDVDFSDLVVHNLTPILADHVDKFLTAQEITKNKKVAKTTEKVTDVNDDTVLASNYNRGLLHAGIKLNSETPDTDISTYISGVVDRILPYLLEEDEIKSAPVRILIRELLSCCVLNPVCSMLTDPDFYNQIVVSNLSKQMKDRNNVKKFRNVLRRHSMSFNNMALPASEVNDILQFKVSIDTPKHDFEKILQMVERSTDKQSLLRYKYYILLRNEKLLRLNPTLQIEESKTMQKYAKRCNTLLDAINYKIREITEGEDKRKADTENIATTDHLEFLPQNSLVKDLSLHEILSSPTRLKYFTSYMQLRGDRQILLDFWLSAENLRNPLEYNSVQAKPSLAHVNNSEEDDESSDDEATTFVDNELTQAKDIKNIFTTYFNLPVMKIPPKIFYKVSEFIEGNCTSTLAYYRARKSILKLQDFEYIRMKKSDFVAFKASDTWLKLLVDEAVSIDHKGMKESSSTDILAASADFEKHIPEKVYTGLKNTDKILGDPLAKYSEKENDGNYVDVNMTGKVSDKVVRAVEDALNEIMKDSNKSDVDLSVTNDKRNSRLVSDDVARDLFGNGEKSLFGDEEEEEDEEEEGKVLKGQGNKNLAGANIQSSTELDGDTAVSLSQDNSSLASNSSEPENPMEKSDLKVVAPSVLNLYNEIERLDVEIDRLQKQRLILKALLQKAEVINNVPELRILKKSLISLEKELKFKSMQKEQYIVQEGENSLYGRSKVTIPSYITAKDKNGKSFIMYVIKMTTLSRSDANQITANWMVTRRFSQFYELHNYLKSKYPVVSTMEFPKKKMVVKFIQGSLIEERQKKLKSYLQALVRNKDVCSDKIFRDFLSSETFDATLDDTLQHVNEKIKKNTDGSGTRLYNIISSQAFYPLFSLANYKGLNDQMEEKNRHEKDSETSPSVSVESDAGIDDTFNMDDENITTPESRAKDISFMKPICDLIVSIFQLNNSTSWFRGRALILLFQQLFGSTVEKVLRANIDGKIKQEETISKVLTGLQYTLWPDGEFKKKRIPRTDVEKERTKQQTRMLLNAFLTDTSSKIFGQTAANRASDTLYFVFQNDILNRHLLLSILDECFAAIFPEIGK